MSIEDQLVRAEESLARGGTLAGTGFWRAVGVARRDPAVAAAYAERIGAIDRQAFERGVKMRVPAAVGTAALGVATAAGAGLVAVSGRFPGLLGDAVFLAGFGAITVGSHSLAHWAVGRATGMRFTHVFLGGPPPPRPGVKTDYASYLRVAPGKRAAMHASGALVTKLVPFALLPFARNNLVRIVLVAAGIVQIVTDIVLSTKSSDWKKVRREVRAARAAGRAAGGDV